MLISQTTYDSLGNMVGWTETETVEPDPDWRNPAAYL